MIQRRVIALLVFFLAVGFCIVHLEGEKTRYVRQIAGLRGQLLEFDYQGWQAGAQLAKLCSPAELRERSEKMALGTMAPGPVVDVDGAKGEELAAGSTER